MKQECISDFGKQPRQIISRAHRKIAFCYAVFWAKKQQMWSLHLEENYNFNNCENRETCLSESSYVAFLIQAW